MGHSQKTSKVSATYTYYAPETMSVEEAKRIALERAKIQAIADEFGSVVSQSTSTVMSNMNGQSDTQFFSLGGSDVKGEWIETTGDPAYEIKFENHFLVVNCSIKGKAREITQSKIDFIAKPLRNGTTLKYESTEFRDGDDLTLYFSSPTKGFLSVYLSDEQSGVTFQILPYRKSDGEPVEIEPNKEYIFFSKKVADFEARDNIDEYRLTLNQQIEYNTLYIILSSEKYNTAICQAGDTYVPNYMQSEQFMKWLTSFKKSIKNYKVEQQTIKII